MPSRSSALTPPRLKWFDRRMTFIELVRSTALTDGPYCVCRGDAWTTPRSPPHGRSPQDGAVVSPGDVAAQAQQVMANPAVTLGAAVPG